MQSFRSRKKVSWFGYLCSDSQFTMFQCFSIIENNANLFISGSDIEDASLSSTFTSTLKLGYLARDFDAPSQSNFYVVFHWLTQTFPKQCPNFSLRTLNVDDFSFV